MPARARAGHLTRSRALEKFHELERVAGVTPVPDRGWYGLRRVATDLAPTFTGDNLVLNAVGGWAAGSDEREARYQDHQNRRVRAQASIVREKMRRGTAAPLRPDAEDAAPPSQFRQR